MGKRLLNHEAESNQLASGFDHHVRQCCAGVSLVQEIVYHNDSVPRTKIVGGDSKFGLGPFGWRDHRADKRTDHSRCLALLGIQRTDTQTTSQLVGHNVACGFGS